jgi:hypothetical protein
MLEAFTNSDEITDLMAELEGELNKLEQHAIYSKVHDKYQFILTLFSAEVVEQEIRESQPFLCLLVDIKTLVLACNLGLHVPHRSRKSD